jgi:hypothetical protein
MGVPQGPGGTSWMNSNTSLNYAPTPVLSVQGYLNHPVLPENQVPITNLPTGGMNEFGVGSGVKPAPDGLDAEAGKLGGVLMDLIWPGWPPRLPTLCKSSYISINRVMLTSSNRRSSVCLYTRVS